MSSRVYSIKRFVTAKVEFVDKAVKLECWMAPVDVFGGKENEFPYNYNYSDIDGDIVIQSNEELTTRAISMIAEYSNSIILRQRVINDKRKLANR